MQTQHIDIVIINTNMTIIEQTYQLLKQAKLTTSRESFSQAYLGKNRNWFAWQRHVKRDFSLSAAIQCLRSIRLQCQRGSALTMEQIAALKMADIALQSLLIEQHSVADVSL